MGSFPRRLANAAGLGGPAASGRRRMHDRLRAIVDTDGHEHIDRPPMEFGLMIRVGSIDAVAYQAPAATISERIHRGHSAHLEQSGRFLCLPGWAPISQRLFAITLLSVTLALSRSMSTSSRPLPAAWLIIPQLVVYADLQHCPTKLRTKG